MGMAVGGKGRTLPLAGQAPCSPRDRDVCLAREGFRQHLRDEVQPDGRRRDLRGVPPPLPRAPRVRRHAAARTRCASCSRTCCAPRTASPSPRRASRRWRSGTRGRSRCGRSRSRPPACCCRTSPACPPSSTWPRCATPWPTSAATRARSTRCSRWSWWSTTPSRWTRSRARDAFAINQQLDYSRNRERYALLRWAQRAFANVGVVPPNTGIVHQVNLEYLARVVFVSPETKGPGLSALRRAYPDTLVGTDSHTPMVNGIGVLGWGVGGIEAEAAMLGQAVSMLIPDVIGVRLSGELPDGATATDLVLTVTEMLRRHGVVGKFVEFFGPGVASLTVADRATIGNMSPEYGSTCTIFPVDQGTLDYLRFSGRTEERVAMVEAYMKDQGLFHSASSPEPDFATVLKLDLGTIEPSVAGPRRPQDRVPLARPQAVVPQGAAVAAAASAREHAEGSGGRRQPRRGSGRGLGRGRPGVAGGPRGDGPRARRRARPRLGGHRGDHELHEHVEPVGDAGRGAAGQEGRRARPDAQAVGEDVAGAGIEGGHRLLPGLGAAALPRRPGLQPRRLRLHHLHRELRAASRARSRTRSTARTSWPAPPSPATATSRGASTPTCAPTT